MSYLLKNYGTGNKWYEKPDNVVEKIVITEEKNILFAEQKIVPTVIKLHWRRQRQNRKKITNTNNKIEF